jgi:hypothetical protein
MGAAGFFSVLGLALRIVWRSIIATFVLAGSLFASAAVLLYVVYRQRKSIFFFLMIALAGINISARQPLFINAIGIYATAAVEIYNEFYVEPVSNLYDCFGAIQDWYNMTIAFIQSILYTIARAFGLDLFTFAARSTPMARSDVRVADQEIAEIIDRLVRDGPRVRNVTQVVAVLCDIIRFVCRFLIALLGIFSDAFIFLSDIMLDLFIDDNGDINFNLPEILIRGGIRIVLDFVDPAGCLDSPPRSLVKCVCPGRYPTVASVPSNSLLGFLGCFCPLNGSTNLLKILSDCVDVPVLRDILRLINGIKNFVLGAIGSIQDAIARIEQVRAIVGPAISFAAGRLNTVRSLVCSIPFVECRTVVEVKWEPGPPNRHGMRVMQQYKYTTTYFEGEINDVLVQRERIPSNETDEQMAYVSRVLARTQRVLEDQAWRDALEPPSLEVGHIHDPNITKPDHWGEFRRNVRNFVNGTRVGRNSFLGQDFVRYVSMLAEEMTPRLSEDEIARRTFLSEGASLVGLFTSGLHHYKKHGTPPDVRWFIDQLETRKIDVMRFASAAIHSTQRASGWTGEMQYAVARAGLRIRAVAEPDALHHHVHDLLAGAPWMRGRILQELRDVAALPVLVPAPPPIAPPAKRMDVMPRAIVVTFILSGATTLFFSIQVGLVTLPILAPFLITLLVSLIPFYMTAIGLVAEVGFGLITTLLGGGKFTDVDLVSPWFGVLGSFVSAGFERDYSPADIFFLAESVRDILSEEIEHVLVLLLQRILCVVPRPGITDSCPPRVPFDPNTGRPALGLVEYIQGLLQADPTGKCFRVTDCAGLAKECICDGGRIASDDAPCLSSEEGTCFTWPYMKPRARPQRVTLDWQFNVECEALGFRYRDLGAGSGIGWLEWWWRIQITGFRSLLYVLNSLSVGVDIPWAVLLLGLFVVIPFVKLIAKQTVRWVIVLNVASYATVAIADWALAALDRFPDGAFVDFLRRPLAFPDSTGGTDKGSASFGETFCFWLNLPQFAVFLLFWEVVFFVFAASVVGGLIAALIVLLRYVVGGWFTVFAASGRKFFAAAASNYYTAQ